jgi:predicted O-methyltransferase YrrM
MSLFKSVFKAREEDNIKKALMCKGWTTATQLTLVAKLLRSTESLDGDILEIGSAWGRSTVMMGLSSRKKIWSIDPHTGGIAYILRNEDQGSFEELSR